jgi:hypothetical protein
VGYEGERTHLFYLCAVFVAALGYMAIAQVLNLYRVSSFYNFVPGFTLAFIAWTIATARMAISVPSS